MSVGASPPKGGRQLLQWFLMAAAVLLLVLLIRSLRSAPGGGADEAWRPPLRKGEGAAVVAIELRRDPQPLRLRREGRRWRLTTPVADLASTRTVRELFRALEGLEIRRRLPADSLMRYGLDPPWAILTLEFANGGQRVLRIGDHAPTSGDTYAIWDRLPGVALIPRFVVARFFHSELLSWRETEILPPSPAAIDSLWVFWPSEKARLLRESSERWRFLEPADQEADGVACERAVAAFGRFPFLRFYDDPVERRAIEESPANAQWIVFRGREVDTLRIGGTAADGTMIVQHTARAPGQADARMHALLTGGVAALEMRALFTGRAAEVTQMLVVADGHHRLFWRRGDGWRSGELSAAVRVAAEGGLPPDSAAYRMEVTADATLSGELRNLFWLRGEEWVGRLAAAPKAADYPLRIHLWERDGSHQWAYFQAEEGPPANAGDATAHFAGLAVGSRRPDRLMRVRDDVVARWWFRAIPR